MAARAVAILGVLFAVLTVRVVTGSHAELARGDRARELGDVEAAIAAYRRAAGWYAPGNPYDERALAHLEELATEAEAAGDLANALAAWRSLRGATLAVRWVVSPFEAERGRAEAAIVRLSALTSQRAGRGAARRRVERALARPVGPSVGWSLLVLVGWLAWTGGAFAFAQLAVDEEDRVRSVPARAIGTVMLLGFGLFVIGMALA